MTSKGKLVLWISMAAGGADSLTGLLLLTAPSITLRLMGVQPPGDLVFIRYIGCFVLAVGSGYGFGLLSVLRRGQWEELRVVWKFTAWVRLLVCLFTTSAIAGHALAPAWFSVPLTDGCLALLQGAFLVAGIWPAESGL